MHDTNIFSDIQRMSLHNGEGLRTIVFVKDAPELQMVSQSGVTEIQILKLR